MSVSDNTYSQSTAKRTLPVGKIVAALLVVGLGVVIFNRLHGAPAAPPPQGPVPVEAVTVKSGPAQTWSDFSARTQAVNQADIRPEVSGRITEIRFHDGQTVHQGDILLVIDPRPYQAALAKAQAALSTAKAGATYARSELDRANRMIKVQAIAKSVLDQRLSDARTGDANIQAAQAAVDSASLDVEHAFVRAPIDGRTGRSELTVGNLVEAGTNAPLLTSIVSTDGIYADFDVDEQTYLHAVHARAEGLDKEQQIPVQMIVDGKTYDGTIYTFDNHIDPASGTIRARAKFANTDGALVPGMFVSVRLAAASSTNALTVPEQAIQTDQAKKFVYTIGPDGKAKYTEITPGGSVGSSRIVLSGLKDGDQVIVNGIQHVQPGAAVTTKAPAPPPAKP